jgi:hypothetical protein
VLEVLLLALRAGCEIVGVPCGVGKAKAAELGKVCSLRGALLMSVYSHDTQTLTASDTVLQTETEAETELLGALEQGVRDGDKGKGTDGVIVNVSVGNMRRLLAVHHLCRRLSDSCDSGDSGDRSPLSKPIVLYVDGALCAMSALLGTATLCRIPGGAAPTAAAAPASPPSTSSSSPPPAPPAVHSFLLLAAYVGPAAALLQQRAALGALEGRKFCVFGHPVKQSPSPLLHNTGFGECLLPHFYTAYDTESVESVRAFVHAQDFGGASVTIPFKEQVLGMK